jgi:serine/threonine protein kinase
MNILRVRRFAIALREPLSLDEALGIGIQVAMALEAAHEEGIVHRDIKPENIMLREDRFVRDSLCEGTRLWFGKVNRTRNDACGSKAVTIPVTQTNPGAVIGTTGYMSPEQTEGGDLIRAQISSAWVWFCTRWLRVSNRSKVELTVTRAFRFWITSHHHSFNISRMCHDNSNALYPKHLAKEREQNVIRR